MIGHPDTEYGSVAWGDRRPPGSVRVWPRLVATIATGSLPYADFLAANAGEPVVVGTVAMLWGATVCLLLAVTWGASRRGAVAVARVTVIVVMGGWLFFHYPTVSEVLAVIGIAPALHELGWAVVFTAVVAVLVPLSRHRAVQQYAVVLPVVLLLVPLAAMAGRMSSPAADTRQSAIQDVVAHELPNIYFLVVDGYGSQEVIEAVTGYSIQTFVDDLERAGFVVSPNARANYPLTYLSVASTLQMQYLVDETDQLVSRRSFYAALQGQNETVTTLRGLGYAYVHAEAATWGGSACSGEEDTCIGDPGPDRETARALLRRTPLARLTERIASDAEVLARQSDPSQIVREAISASDRPTFTFAHLMGSHPPFLRAADCTVQDAAIDLEGWTDPARYGDAITCLNAQLRAAVSSVVQDDPGAIIVIQGDHGPSFGAGLDARSRIEQRLSIFSAIRLPPRCSRPPQDLTAVNTFRIVLACLAGRRPELLENHFYWAGYRGPEVLDVGPSIDPSS